jgi:phosphatidate cytidylyltransferase
MAKAQRDVKFRHRNSGSQSRPRRPSQSMSDISESASSEKGSPVRNGLILEDKVRAYVSLP